MSQEGTTIFLCSLRMSGDTQPCMETFSSERLKLDHQDNAHTFVVCQICYQLVSLDWARQHTRYCRQQYSDNGDGLPSDIRCTLRSLGGVTQCAEKFSSWQLLQAHAMSTHKFKKCQDCFRAVDLRSWEEHCISCHRKHFPQVAWSDVDGLFISHLGKTDTISSGAYQPMLHSAATGLAPGTNEVLNFKGRPLAPAPTSTNRISGHVEERSLERTKAIDRRE